MELCSDDVIFAGNFAATVNYHLLLFELLSFQSRYELTYEQNNSLSLMLPLLPDN